MKQAKRHGAYDFCASLGRVVNQPVVRSMLIEQGDKLCVGVFYICLHNQVPLYKNCLCVSILPSNDDIYQWQKRQAASKKLPGKLSIKYKSCRQSAFLQAGILRSRARKLAFHYIQGVERIER